MVSTVAFSAIGKKTTVFLPMIFGHRMTCLLKSKFADNFLLFNHKKGFNFFTRKRKKFSIFAGN